MTAAEPILSVRHLVAGFEDEIHRGGRPAVDDVSFDVRRGSVLAVVGQCGSGKSLTALSILRLLPREARLISGQVLFQGRDLTTLADAELQRVRGRGIGMVFQEPATALSPVHSVGWQLGAALAATGQTRGGLLGGRRQSRARAAELLSRVDLPEPEHLLDSYPHELSAGMRRRVLLAMALAGQPALLIADEPTTGLDATIQSQIVDLIDRLVRQDGLSALLITHDLSAVTEIASDVVVMYAGQVVEAGPVASVFAQPQHPYTALLLADARKLSAPASVQGAAHGDLEPSAGPGCRFTEACPERGRDPRQFPRCSLGAPALEPADARHRSRCFYPRLATSDVDE